MILNKTFSTINLDKIAVYLSVFCAVQCLLLPLSALLLPTLSAVPLADEWFHSLLLFFVIPTSVFAMALGCKKHKSYNVIFYGLIGENGEIISTLVGTSILSYGHIRNQKLCKLCCH
jgi:hypothetical protein